MRDTHAYPQLGSVSRLRKKATKSPRFPIIREIEGVRGRRAAAGNEQLVEILHRIVMEKHRFARQIEKQGRHRNATLFPTQTGVYHGPFVIEDPVRRVKYRVEGRLPVSKNVWLVSGKICTRSWIVVGTARA